MLSREQYVVHSCRGQCHTVNSDPGEETDAWTCGFRWNGSQMRGNLHLDVETVARDSLLFPPFVGRATRDAGPVAALEHRGCS